MSNANKKIIILGGGGNATVIASAVEDIIDARGGYEITGYLDDMKEKGVNINGYPILGIISEAETFLKDKDVCFVYSLLTAKKVDERAKKLEALNLPIERFVTLVHPKATVSRHSKVGYGVVIMPGVVVSPNVSIGNFVLVYANSLIGHDTNIEDYSFIANCVSIGSTVQIKRGAYLGSNSSIREKIIIGEKALVGLGAVVTKDVPPGVTVVGNPAKELL